MSIFRRIGGVRCEMLNEIPVGKTAPQPSAGRQRAYGILGEACVPCGVPQRTSLLLRLQQHCKPWYVVWRRCRAEEHTGSERLAAKQYQFEESDAWLDLWCHTVFDESNNVFSFLAPAVQYGKYGAVLNLEALGQRWG